MEKTQTYQQLPKEIKFLGRFTSMGTDRLIITVPKEDVTDDMKALKGKRVFVTVKLAKDY